MLLYLSLATKLKLQGGR